MHLPKKWKERFNSSHLEMNSYTQRFNDLVVEKEFRNQNFKKSIFALRFSLFISILLFAAFGFFDKITSLLYYQEFYFIRYIIIVPLLVIIIGISYLKNFERIWQGVISFAIITSGTGLIYMLHRNPENIYYYGGLFLIFMGCYFYMKLRFSIAVLTGVGLIILYNLVGYFLPVYFHEEGHNLLLGNAFFIASNIICMVGLYDVEYFKRADFVLHSQLYEKQMEIEEINDGLEDKVKDRTERLNVKNIVLEAEIDRRKEIENKLLEAKCNAEESDRLKSAFLANMSHEIRTPMNGILGFADLLRTQGITSTQKDSYIQIIKKSGNRLLNTVNDIIEISKIETGQVESVITQVNIHRQMHEVYTLFRLEAEEKGLQLLYFPPSQSLSTYIDTDDHMFYSIVSNLIKNAVKYTKTGSIEFGYNRKGKDLEFYVKDTGIGISQERQMAIFERFVQADIEDRNAKQGSGLGLSIVKAYVEILGGKVWCDSEPDKGSRFYFSIPWHDSSVYETDTAEAYPLALPNIKGKTVLLVEDEEFIYYYYEEVLADTGLNLVWKNNGADGIAYCMQNENVDLVLMDIKMPGMNGYEATKEIKKHRANLPVIAQTAYAINGDKEEILSAGFDDYITKPIDVSKLFELINRYLS